MISNEIVHQNIKILQKKVLELRIRYPKHEFRPRLMKFFKGDIALWVEYDINNDKENYSYNDKIMDRIIDWINRIDVVLKDKSENIKKSELKTLIKEILKEWRGATSGEWVEPNGTAHDLGHSQDMSDHHYAWAEKYLETHGPHRFKDDPRDELIARGWLRVVYSPNDHLIMVMVGYRDNKYFTKAQRAYLEDRAEETGWKVVDDDLHDIYKPFNCTTPDDSDDTLEESHGLGYSHNSTDDYSNIPFARDTLNDPLLTGKMNESYRFQDYHWLANMAGFNKPTDVYYGSILLGVIVSQPDGYVIERILGPHGTISVKKTPNNKFKTKEKAAEVLHRAWKLERTKESGEEWKI